MKCFDARPHLDALCDGTLEPKTAAPVLDHIRQCDACEAQWESLEIQRVRERTVRPKQEPTEHIAGHISQLLKLEDIKKAHQQNLKKKQAPLKDNLRTLAVIAAIICVVAGLAMMPIWQPVENDDVTDLESTAVPADVVARTMKIPGAIQPVESAALLRKQAGYQLKTVSFPQWSVKDCGLYRSPSGDRIARFSFARQDAKSGQLSCYQALEGTIKPNLATEKKIGSKNAWVGSSAGYRFILWTQNGRDYLLVSDLSQADLESLAAGI